MTTLRPRRLPDWERRFAAWLESVRHRPFEWGKHDCLQFGIAGIREVRGQDLMPEPYIYHTAEQAAQWLREDGFASLRECVTHHLGPPFQNYRDAMRGDAALVDFDGLHVLGTVLGERIAAPGKDGLVFVPTSRAICCWRV